METIVPLTTVLRAEWLSQLPSCSVSSVPDTFDGRGWKRRAEDSATRVAVLLYIVSVISSVLFANSYRTVTHRGAPTALCRAASEAGSDRLNRKTVG